jgi:competence protein ComEC
MATDVYARLLAPVVMSFMAGIVAGRLLPGFALTVSIGLAAALLATVISLRRSKKGRFAPVLVFFLLGYLSLQPWLVPGFPVHHISHFTGQQKWRLTGTIVSRPFPRANRFIFQMAVEAIEGAGVSRPATGRLRVTAVGSTCDFARGHRIAFESRLRRPRNFHNPGGFDYERHLAFQKIWATAYCALEDVALLSDSPTGGIGHRIDRLRDRILDLIDTTADGAHRGVLAALIVGERGGLTPETTAAFRRIGIGHLLAISGLHIGIVAATVFFLLSRLMSHFQWFLWNAAIRRWAALGTFLPVAVYALLAGMSPSTQRALVMVCVFLLAVLVGRDQDLLNTLAAAAMLLLVVDPPVLFSASFQLSFAAVLAIVCGLSCFPSLRLQHPLPLRARLVKKASAFVLVSIWATLGTLPLTMYYFNQVSVVGIFSNCLFVPIIGFVVVPCGLLAAFLLPVSAAAAAGLMHLAAAVLSQTLTLVSLVARLPFAAFQTVTPSILEMTCYYLLVILVATLASRHWPTSAMAGESPYRRPRVDHPTEKMASGGSFNKKARLAVLALTFVVVAFAADIGYWVFQRVGRQDLRVTVLDVGQGSAALLELPGGYCILLDGGGMADNAVFDVGARIIAPFLWRKKIKTVETLILTHPNSDHLNGLIYIAEHFNVKKLWTNGEPGQIAGYRQLMNIVAKRKILHPAFSQLERRMSIAGVDVEILNPLPGFIKNGHAKRASELNNNSLVLRFVKGKTSFLFCGDIEAETEKTLVARHGDRLSSTILLIPHHGSLSSSTPGFVKAVRPRIGVVSAGWRNRYRFPHPAVVERYRQFDTRLLRTDRNGAISLTADGRQLSIRTAISEGHGSPAAAVETITP